MYEVRTYNGITVSLQRDYDNAEMIRVQLHHEGVESYIRKVYGS